MARQERGDLCGRDSYPETVSSRHVEKQKKGDPCSSGIPKEHLLTIPTKNPRPNKMRIPSEYRETPCHSDKRECLPKLRENLMDDRVPENNDSHASSSHESSSERVPARSVDLVNTVSMLTSLKTEIARSVTGLKLQRPRAEDAMAEAYTVLKILVTW